MKNWTFLLTTFYFRHGLCGRWIREAITDNAECDGADRRHVNASAAGHALNTITENTILARPRGPNLPMNSFLSLISVVDCIDGVL